MNLMRVNEFIGSAIIKSRKLKEGMLRGYWKEIVGNLYKKSEPVKIKDKILYVIVEDAIYLHHMSMNKNNYLDNIEKLLKDRYIIDIRFRVSALNGYDYSGLSKKIAEEKFKEQDLKEFRVKSVEFSKLTIEKKIEILKKESKERERRVIDKGYKRCRKCGKIFFGENDYCDDCPKSDRIENILEDK